MSGDSRLEERSKGTSNDGKNSPGRERKSLESSPSKLKECAERETDEEGKRNNSGKELKICRRSSQKKKNGRERYAHSQ